MREGWTYKKLVDECAILYGYPFDSKNFSSSNEDMPLVRIRDVKEGATSTYYKGEYPKEYIIHKGDFLIGMDGEFNISPWQSDDALLNQRVCKIASKSSDVLMRYVYRFLVKELKKIEDETPFVTVKHLSAKKLNQIKLPIPPLSEQERIVSELDLLSSIIEKKKAQLKEYDQLAQSIFYDMFGDPITNEKGWEVKKLGDVGIIVAGSTPSTNDESNWDGHVNWVTPAELGEQLYYGETARKLTDKGAKGLTMMPVGTVLLSSRAPIGKLAITTVPMCCNQGFKNIICNNTINNVFLYYYLKNTMDLVQALGRGATFKEVSKSAISSYKIILPPLSLQQSFAEKIETIEHQKALIQQSIAETETLFNSRMDYYFN